jgi:hypothetical protein
VIELVVPESPMAQGSPAEELQQSENHDVEDKPDEEQPPLSDTKNEKMYRDADEVESFGAEAPVPAGKLWALLEHLGITTAPRYRMKEVPCTGWVEFKAIVEIFLGSKAFYRHKGSTFKASRSDVVAELHPLPPTLQEEGSIQALWCEEGCSQDGDGAPPGCDGGAEHLFASRPAQD